MKKRILATVLALLLVMSALVACAPKDDGDDDTTPKAEKETVVLMSSENFEITLPMMAYLVYNQYSSLLNTYEQYGIQFGGITLNIPGGKGGDNLDKNASLREQIYQRQDENGNPIEAVTWYQHFVDLAKTQASEMLAYAEYANANGIVLTDADVAALREEIATLDATLYDMGYQFGVGQYYSAVTGNATTQGDVLEIMKLSRLSEKVKEVTSESFYNAVTKEEADAYLAEHKDDFKQEDDEVLRSVGHILFKSETFKDGMSTTALTEGQRKLVERIVAKGGSVTSETVAAELVALMREEGAITEKQKADGTTYLFVDKDAFGAYGKAYTEDSNVFYDDVEKDQMVKAFEEWMFDAARVEGEMSNGGVATEYGHHVMLYVGNEKNAKEHAVKEKLAELRADELKNSVLETYKATANEDAAAWDLIGNESAA